MIWQRSIPCILRTFVSLLKRHANRQNKNYIFCPCVDCENKIAWLDPKVVQSHLIKRGFKRNYTLWTKHGEIDDTLHEMDIGVRDNNSDGVFDGDDPDADDDFDYQELLHHVKPQVLSSMGTETGLSNMDILEKSSKDLLYDQSKISKGQPLLQRAPYPYPKSSNNPPNFQTDPWHSNMFLIFALDTFQNHK
jgi:hypothetical protein